jgi:hypothetical protein
MIPSFNAAGKIFCLGGIHCFTLILVLAPYSSSATSTTAGLTSASFMNTYGTSVNIEFSQPPPAALTSLNTFSIPLHNYGRSNADLPALRDSHQRRLHAHLPVPASCLPPPVRGLLATR